MSADPVILLDVDGVLHPVRPSGHPLRAAMEDLIARVEAEESIAGDDHVGRVVEGEFVQECMAALGDCVRASGARIVLSSTWRETAPQRRAVDAQLVKHGLPPHEGCTPRLSVIEGGRAAEIIAWAAERDCNPGASTTCWVALDDQEGLEHKLPATHFVKVDPALGLTAADAERACELLRQQQCAALGVPVGGSTGDEAGGASGSARRRRGGMQRSTLGMSLEDGRARLQIELARAGGGGAEGVDDATTGLTGGSAARPGAEREQPAPAAGAERAAACTPTRQVTRQARH